MKVVTLARKPISSVVDAASTWGAGGVHIEKCRLPGGMDDTPADWARKGSGGKVGANGYAGQFSKGMKDAYARGDISLPSGRWPKNLIFQHLLSCTEDCSKSCVVLEIHVETEGLSRLFKQVKP